MSSQKILKLFLRLNAEVPMQWNSWQFYIARIKQSNLYKEVIYLSSKPTYSKMQVVEMG